MYKNNNVFDRGHSKDEVKNNFKECYASESKAVGRFDVISLICVVFLCRHWAIEDIIAATVGFWSASSAMRYFIDASNRNFYLHRLDWEQAESENG